MVITGLNPKNKINNWKFIEAMGLIMTGRSNNDGLGYTAVDKNGNIFGERWLVNDEAFDIRTQPEKVEKKFLGFLEEEPDVLKYTSFGKRTDEIVAITLHTRLATSARGIVNTHPFVDMEKETSLIHNGVISNVSKEDNIRSTCDSERILNKYLEFNVNKNPVAIQAVVDSLRGNFACGVITVDQDGKRVVDVFKSRAQLGGAAVRELDNAMVITTEKSDIKDVCKHLGMKMLSQHAAKEDILIRFDAITGKAILSMAYKDTASQSNYNHNNYNSSHSSSHGRWNGTRYEHANENKLVTQEELEQKRLANAAKAEAEKTTAKLGDIVSEADLQEMYDNTSSAQAAADTINKVASDLEQSKAIVKKAANIHDPLSEDDAAKDGYFLCRDGSWGKLDKAD